MTKQPIWGYPWPCLCLAFIGLTFSCTVKHQSKTVINEFKWEVKAWFKAEDINWNIMFNDSTIVVPYSVNKVTNGNGFNRMVVSYRLNNMTQALLIKQKLLESGYAENITIMNYDH